MLDPVIITLGLAQIFLQLGAAYFAYETLRVVGTFRAWTLIVLALLLMTVRRMTALAIEAGFALQLGGALGFIDRFVLPLVISICFLVALWDLRRIFLRELKRS